MLEGFVEVLSKMFGSKHERDVKELQPVIDHILEIEKTLLSITHDELRAKTDEFKKRILDRVAEKEQQKKELKESVEQPVSEGEEVEDMPVKEKEAVYTEIDNLEKEIIADIKDELSIILPEAFAVMRETTRRLKEFDTLEVTATDIDKELAKQYDHVVINGTKATWHSSWTVRAHKVKWDMVPYPVQLIGGAVLHSGKIAEMATGEGKTLVAILPMYLMPFPAGGFTLLQ